MWKRQFASEGFCSQGPWPDRVTSDSRSGCCCRETRGGGRPGTRPAGTALAEKLEGRLQGIRSSTRLHAYWSADFRSRQARLDRGGAQGGGSAMVHRGSVGGGKIYGVVAQE